MKKVFEKTYALSTDELGDIVGRHIMRREALAAGYYKLVIDVLSATGVMLVTFERFEDEELPPAAMVLD